MLVAEAFEGEDDRVVGGPEEVAVGFGELADGEALLLGNVGEEGLVPAGHVLAHADHEGLVGAAVMFRRGGHARFRELVVDVEKGIECVTIGERERERIRVSFEHAQCWVGDSRLT